MAATDADGSLHIVTRDLLQGGAQPFILLLLKTGRGVLFLPFIGRALHPFGLILRRRRCRCDEVRQSDDDRCEPLSDCAKNPAPDAGDFLRRLFRGVRGGIC